MSLLSPMKIPYTIQINFLGKHFQADPDHLSLCILHLCWPASGPNQEELHEEADIHHTDGDSASRAEWQD